MPSLPTPLARFEERVSTVPNPFTASFRIELLKRHRTMDGALVEAVDGMNTGESIVPIAPADPIQPRIPLPKLPLPQLERDLQQAIYAWRDREEAETLQREKARRPRPGVHFEGYEDHPEAERRIIKYVGRGRDPIRG